MEDTPTVFISYSHDSAKHKGWVEKLASDLRKNGVDATLDQWEIGPGDDLAAFMERGVTTADRVLAICTPKYVNKANAGEGGVGYEKMIVTAELVKNLGTKKFIPIVRDSEGEKQVPVFLGSRLYIDFDNDSLKFRSSFLPAWQFPLVDLQRLKPKRLGVKLKDLQKPALYMCINGVHN